MFFKSLVKLFFELAEIGRIFMGSKGVKCNLMSIFIDPPLRHTASVCGWD